MKKLLSIHYNAFAFNASMLLLRISLGLLMMAHGYDKLVHFNERKANWRGYSLVNNIIAVAYTSIYSLWNDDDSIDRIADALLNRGHRMHHSSREE